MNLLDRPTLDQALLNDWQRHFPLGATPFADVAERCGSDEATVLRTYQRLLNEGSISRIGGVWGTGAGGAAMLCALAVPRERLSTVATLVNAIPGVNHNYEREHRYNLWFVITGRDQAALDEPLDGLEATTGLRALRLPMVRPYRIDLGFDLRRVSQPPHAVLDQGDKHRPKAPPVERQDEALAALVEEGLPLVSRPYDAWAQALGLPAALVRQRIAQWLEQGTLRRLGVVVRHHNLGISANAMTVVDVPDELVDAAGARLASQPGITLCYRRQRGGDWPFNLYFMVHGHDRVSVGQFIEAALEQTGLSHRPRQTLFSGQRFKQTGGRYFRHPATATQTEGTHEQAA
jgi:DNA-binding Lrp family transcriptional regulator